MSEASRDLTGGCLCGAIRYRANGTPRHVTHCHCITCRRASGAPFVTWFTVDETAFAWTQGTPVSYRSSASAERSFCPRCGTQLAFREAHRTGEVDVTAASLDDPAALQPQDHTWVSRKLPWIAIEDHLPRHDTVRPDDEF
jgi:hypothetical protein